MSEWYDPDELQELDDVILDALEAEAMVGTDDTGFEVNRDSVTLRATWKVDGGDD